MSRLRAASARRVRPFDLAAALYVAAYVWWNLAHQPGTPLNDAIADWAFYPLGLVVGTLFVRNVLAGRPPRLDPRTRLAWSLLAGSAFLLWVSGTAWAYYVATTGPAATPAWIDAAELGQLGLTIAAVVAFPSRGPGAHGRARFWLDLALLFVAAASAAGLYGAAAIAPVTPSGWTASVWLRAATDWGVFFSLSAAALYKRDRTARGVAGLLLAANVSVLAGNWILPLLPEYRSGNSVDLLWFGAWTLKAAAARYAWHHYQRPPEPNESDAAPAATALPHAIVIAGFGLLVHQVLTVPARASTFVYSASVMTVLLALRQIAELREHRRLFETRLAQEARFRSLVQNASDVTLVVDDAGIVSYVSPSAGRVLGPGAIEPGTALRDVLPPDDLAFLDALPRLPAAGRRLGCRMRTAAGGWREVEVLAADMREDAAVRGIVLNCRDVTDRNEAERRLQHAQKLGAVGRLAGGLAHDFNNVLTSVRGEAELLSREVPAGSAAAADLDGILQAVDRAAAVTGKLLAFSRRQEVTRTTIDLRRVLTGLQPLLQQLAGPGIVLDVVVDASLWPVRADEGQIEQVVINLVTNARDATASGGTIRVAADKLTVNQYAATGVPPGDYARVVVSDNGHGMPESVRQRVFEPFFSTKPRDKGTGLGLAMVHEIVTQSGGSVAIESVEGRGTTCTVLLPRSAVPLVADAGPSQEPVARRAAARRVLVVDDESAVRRVVRRLLEQAGFDVVEASGGDEALARVEEAVELVDVLLTDLVMPGMDGQQLIREVLARSPKTAVVCMTGYSGERAMGGRVARQWPILFKPFKAEALLLEVASAADGTRGTR
jgi:two-component system, cell cycle sensor histidine kinase and response regulator CckA